MDVEFTDFFEAGLARRVDAFRRDALRQAIRARASLADPWTFARRLDVFEDGNFWVWTLPIGGGKEGRVLFQTRENGVVVHALGLATHG